MQSAMPVFTVLDQSILTAAQNFTSNLWDAYGAPRRQTSEEIAEQIGSDQVDVHYAMKALKRKGHLDHSGVVMNPVPPTTAEGFFSVQDVMRNMNAAPIELEPVEDSPCEDAINSALKTFCAATELGYEYVSPECYSPQDVARLTTRQTMTAQELSQASETTFFAASTMAAYLDQCWVKLGAKTPDRWTGRIEECRVEFQKFLSEFTRPMANTDIDLVRNVLLGLLRELERLTERALRDLSNQKSPTIPPQMPSPVQTHIDALKKAIEQHIPLDSAFEIVPALQCDLARRMESTNTAGFPDKLTEKSLHGIVGDFVAASLDFTEADENALAYQFIVAVGNLFGVGSYASFGADRHYPNLFQLIVGPTSAGKGQSLSAVRSCLSLVDSTWLDRLKHSAASGEALVRMVSEAEDDPRMLVVLSEMSVLLNSSNRDGSNLSGYLRMAYDGAPLEHNRAQKSYRATNYLLSTIGHITPQELSETMANVDWYNGSTNRFLFAACKKSKTLPRMSAAPDFHKMRWEDIAWDRGMIFIPRGKTRRSRRHIPMSERVITALHLRRNGKTEGWVFPSDSRCGHITSVAKAFEQARDAVGVSKEIVLYSARHTFATKVMGATGDLSLVMRALGHSNAQTAMIYQHPSLETVRSVVNENQLSTLLRHSPRHTAVM